MLYRNVFNYFFFLNKGTHCIVHRDSVKIRITESFLLATIRCFLLTWPCKLSPEIGKAGHTCRAEQLAAWPSSCYHVLQGRGSRPGLCSKAAGSGRCSWEMPWSPSNLCLCTWHTDVDSCPDSLPSQKGATLSHSEHNLFLSDKN